MKQHYQGLGHIAVYTADMDASIAFYEKIGGRLHLRAPACPPEQQRELALVEFGGFLVELIAAPCRRARAASPISLSMWTMWTRPRRPSKPPGWIPSGRRRSA